MVRMFSLSILCMAAIAAAAQQPKPLKLPIDVPKEASVNFEAEGTGKSFISTIKQFLMANPVDPSGTATDKIPVKTPLGNFDMRVDDLAPLLDNVHSLHLVSYTALPNEDPFKHYEKEFTADGLTKVTSTPGANGVLIMRHSGKTDQFGIVTRQKENVLVLRTDGAPGLGDFGKVLFEALSHAIQQAVHNKQHG